MKKKPPRKGRMLISANRVPQLVSMLACEFPRETSGILGKSLRIFYRNLMYAISVHLSNPDKRIEVTIPTGQLDAADLDTLESMLLNSSWDIIERDRDYYKVTPGLGELSEEQQIMSGRLCPDCKVPTVFQGGRYECPVCMAQVECHPGTTAAMGFVAREPLRKLRHKLHQRMDELWLSKRLTREEVYCRLRQKMGLTKAMCHVAKFNASQCKQAMEYVAEITEDTKTNE